MPSIIFIEHDGTRHDVEVEEGQSLMQAAVDNMVPGIDGDCGGACACGTCHVILSEEWFAKTGNTLIEERHMLDMKPEKVDTSRLACQIDMSEALDGMEVQLPEYQM